MIYDFPEMSLVHFKMEIIVYIRARWYLQRSILGKFADPSSLRYVQVTLAHPLRDISRCQLCRFDCRTHATEHHFCFPRREWLLCCQYGLYVVWSLSNHDMSKNFFFIILQIICVSPLALLQLHIQIPYRTCLLSCKSRKETIIQPSLVAEGYAFVI